MTDIASTARTARESLAKGLSALQSDPNIPPPLLELAGTIAQAMGALHQIERNNGALVPHASNALNGVRTALSALQAQPATHPAVAQAMEAVAGALGLVHALNKLAGPQVAPPPQYAPPPQQAAPQQAAPQYAPPPQQAAPQYAPPPQQAAPQYAPPPQQAQPVWNAPTQAAPPQQQWAPPPQQAAADPFAAPRQSPMAATAVAQAPPGGVFQPNSARPPSPPQEGNIPVVAADLGAHSPTNFYKGLSGNDVIDHGGLFVSTYMIPSIGAPVRLRVSLPGGYEFEANAIVRWSREQGGDAPPGFGAQFTAITPEARQLVQRYVRNREPLFHDDL